MRRRALTTLLSFSQKPTSPFFSPFSLTTTNSLQSSDLSLQSSKLSTTTTSQDHLLAGLIDPEEGEVDQGGCPGSQVVGSEEFEFLKDALLSSSTESLNLDVGKPSNEATLIVDTILNNSVNGFGDETRNSLRQFRGKLSPGLVIDVLNSIRRTDLGVKFFIWAGKQIGYSHTLPVYDALVEMMRGSGDGGCGSGRLSDQFLSEIREDDHVVLGKFLNVLIRKCCKNGLWNLALEELGRLKDYGYKPSRATYNALVQVFLKAERLDTADLVNREMSTLGYRMDGYTLGCFTHSLCRVGKWREALALVEKEEFVPDTVLYTKMIAGLCEASLFEEAMDFLNRMRASSCMPNVITFRILLCGCLSRKKLGRCKRILSMMIAEGCYPSSSMFNSLVHAYCRSGDYAYAYKLLKIMGKCGSKSGYVVYNILIGGICGNKVPPTSDALELAEKIFNEMLDAGVVLNKVNVSNFARCLCGAAKFDKACKVITKMMSKGFIPDTSTYSKVISFMCNASKVEEAFVLFEEMKRNSVSPDVHTYTTLIDSFCKAGLIEQARSWFDEMEKDGCVPNVVTYTSLIHAYLKVRKISKSNELFEMMLSRGCIPNIVTYTALIDGYCKAGQIEKACQIYARMKDNLENPNVDIYFQVTNIDSMEPNVYTYGALIDGLCKAHKVKEAHDLLEAMSSEGNCEPNHIVYDALIDGFCKVGKLDEAQEVFMKMSEHGYAPTIYTYSCLIDRLFKDKRLDLVMKVLSKMLENSCAPNVVVYTEMIDGLCKVGKTEEAHKLMIMMEEKGCHPNVVTYTAMIDGFGKVGNIVKCLELLKKMGTKGVSPNFVTYSVVIKHCCSVGLFEEACILLEEMKQTYWPKHITGYRKVIEGFSREFIASHGLVVEIGENDSAPFIPVYNLLIDNFVKAGRLEMALKLLEELASSAESSDYNQSATASLIESLSLARRVDTAFELYADMIDKGFVPELTVLVHLVKGLVSVNRWEEALQLTDAMCQKGIKWVQPKDS